MCHKYTNTQIHKYSIFLNSWWFKDVKNDNTKYSDPRYTVDFCTVPPGLFVYIFRSDGSKIDESIVEFEDTNTYYE